MDDGPAVVEPLLARLARALAVRYTVEHELGRGGMATVFLGQDLRHERRVAIKVFEKEGGLIAAGERFLREIRIVAKLQHPNILPVFESGEGEGLVYYVMPYVTGGSVRERLEREGPLPVGDAVRIAREVAEALDHAHRAGIVHRDIKPDNIMLADGVAVVADFGIARAIEQSGGKVTDTGLAIGTPAYMSPEQATAESKLDGRSDQYALGCVLYELLAGTPPFTGPTSQAVMARHAADAVAPLTTLRTVPVALERAIVKALAKVPADRWPTAKAFGEALEKAVADSGAPSGLTKWLVRGGIGAGALSVAVAGWLLLSPAGGSDAVAATLKRVAVLPFKFIGDTSQAYIADGLAEAVHSGLVRAQGLLVTEPSRVAAYRDSLLDVRVIGRRLGLDAAVTATVQRIGNSLRVTPHLVDPRDGRDLWSEHYDGEMGDVFAFQDSITVKVVQALLPRLTPTGRAAVVRGVRTRDPEAWKLYVQANQAMNNMSEASILRAKTLLEQAIARDSAFSDAWAALVPALDFYSRFSRDPPEDFNAAIRRAANQAVDLDSLNTLALVQRSWTRMLQDWDLDGALRDAQRAIRISPGSDAEATYGALIVIMQPDSGLAHYRRAPFDSTSAASWEGLAFNQAIRGKPDSAVASGERAVAIDSTMSSAYSTLALSYLDVGRRRDADGAVNRFLDFSGNDAQGIGWTAVYYRRARDTAGARAMLGRLDRVRRERTWGIHSAMSMVRLALGDREGALDAVEAAARAHEYLLPAALAVMLTPLRGEPRFEAVRQKVYGNRRFVLAPFP